MNLTLKIFVLSAVLLGIPSFANRCLWNPVLHQPRCCRSDQQALWNDRINQPICVQSYSGDSCVWNPIGHFVKCCQPNQHAVWNETTNILRCFDLP